MHDTFPQTKEHMSLPFYSTIGPDDNKNGTTIALNELLRYEHIHNTRGLTICLQTTGWCASENDKGKSCTEQYFEALPTCTSIQFHDDNRDGFTISIKGTILTQFVLKDQVGTILGATKNHAFKALNGINERKEMAVEDYYEKFATEERDSPFGRFYYGIFNQLIRGVFVNGTMGSIDLLRWSSVCSSACRGSGSGSDSGSGSGSGSGSNTNQCQVATALPLNVVEVGLARAGHSSNILAGLDHSIVSTLYGVDPYLAFYDPSDIFAVKKQAEFDAMHLWVQQRLNKEENDRSGTKGSNGGRINSTRFQLLRTTSTKAVQLLSDVNIHAVFVDGDHRASAVLEDLSAWYPKIVPGGLIAGDDYHLPGVAEGVALFLNTFDAADRPVVVSVGVVEHYQLFALTKPC